MCKSVNTSYFLLRHHGLRTPPTMYLYHPGITGVPYKWLTLQHRQFCNLGLHRHIETLCPRLEVQAHFDPISPTTVYWSQEHLTQDESAPAPLQLAMSATCSCMYATSI